MVLYFPSLFSTSETGKVTALPQYSPQGGAVKGPSILLDVTSASKYDVILVRLWSDMKLGAQTLAASFLQLQDESRSADSLISLLLLPARNPPRVPRTGSLSS